MAPKGSFTDRLEYHDPAPVLLVGEGTSSSTAQRDRHSKARGYAATGIPVYVLIDREAGTAKAYSPAADGRYTHCAETVFGKTLTLPEPVGVELDTAEF